MNQRKEQNRSMISGHGKVTETIRGERILLETPEHLAKECEATREIMKTKDERDLSELKVAIRKVVYEIYKKTRVS